MDITIKVAPSPAHTVTEETLKQAPGRFLAFAEGVKNRDIGTALGKGGFSKAQLKAGWALIHELQKSISLPAAAPSPSGGRAIAVCEAFESTEIACGRALLEQASPELAAYLYHDYVPGRGTAAAFSVGVILARILTLESGAARKATRKADHEGLAILERAGMTKARRKEVAHAINELESNTESRPDAEVAEAAANDAAHLETLRKIHAWVTMWSDVARATITRRDHLITLGIAKRRVTKRKAPITPVAAPSTPVTAAGANDDVAPPSRAA